MLILIVASLMFFAYVEYLDHKHPIRRDDDEEDKDKKEQKG
jgi:hypothetical protein